MNLKLAFQKLARSIRKRVPFLREVPAGPTPILSRLRQSGEPSTETPPRMLDIGMLFRRHGIAPRGVIHVGAHQAGELDDYIALGFLKIVYVEANPALIPALRAKAALHPGKVFVVHAAASERNGSVMLRITSMDQSSSILPLGKHLDIYPSIREVGSVEVQSRTLDTLMDEEGLSPSDFNFLNLDIQGAELMALRGAPRLLSCVEAVNTEVNLQELYRGAGLLKDLEAHMAAAGFNRAAMVTPWHPSWGDAFYVRKPVVTMTSLGRNGRFANQLFQYLFLRLVARRQGAVVQTPPWVGQELFSLDDPAPVLAFPEWREPVDELAKADAFKGCVWTSHFGRASPAFASTDYWGYFMGHSSDLAHHRDFIRQLFRLSPEISAALDQRLERLRATRPRILAIHLRRGDYGYGNFFRAPCSWYEQWLRDSGLDPAEWLIYICSEDPRPYRGRFAGFRTMDASDVGLSGDLSAHMDFHVMTRADRLLVSNSSFSFMAAMLNERSAEFARPCAQAEKIVPFDPWDAPVLLQYVPPPEVHRRFIAQD